MICFADKGNKCSILQDKIRLLDKPCKGNYKACRFYKTEEQFKADLKKYPFDSKYASTHK